MKAAWFAFGLGWVVTLSMTYANEVDPNESASLKVFCQDLVSTFSPLGWKIEPCPAGVFRVGGQSVKGRPLVYAEFGNRDAHNTTLILAMVHGDEITPLYLGLQLSQFLTQNYSGQSKAHIVIAPLVNPDSYFNRPRLRVNANGVDVNRNFGTKDWQAQALKAWKGKFRSNPRRFPGHTPDSEPETLFQKKLIEQFKPDKIISVHAPLNVMDYDGPNQLTLKGFTQEYVEQCNLLRNKVRAKSTGFFPGSLGNYSGHNLGIPTFTLELPTSNPKLADDYWKKFKEGIKAVIEYEFK